MSKIKNIMIHLGNGWCWPRTVDLACYPCQQSGGDNSHNYHHHYDHNSHNYYHHYDHNSHDYHHHFDDNSQIHHLHNNIIVRMMRILIIIINTIMMIILNLVILSIRKIILICTIRWYNTNSMNKEKCWTLLLTCPAWVQVWQRTDCEHWRNRKTALKVLIVDVLCTVQIVCILHFVRILYIWLYLSTASVYWAGFVTVG